MMANALLLAALGIAVGYLGYSVHNLTEVVDAQNDAINKMITMQERIIEQHKNE